MVTPSREEMMSAATASYFPTDSGIMRYYENIYDVYAESDFGKHHAEQPPRFSGLYGYDAGTMITDLGDDVHPVRHMKHAHDKLMVPLITAQISSRTFRQFNLKQVRALRLATLIHDIGECTHPKIEKDIGYSVGDVPANAKTSQDELKEAVIRKYVYGKLFADVPDTDLTRAEVIVQSKWHGVKSHVADAFNAAEVLGYYLTALRAGELAFDHIQFMTEQNNDYEYTHTQQLARLALQVTAHQQHAVDEAASKFPFVAYSLKRNHSAAELIATSLEKTAYAA